MNILQGFIDIGGQASRYSQAIKQQGFHSEAWFYERTLKTEHVDRLLDFNKIGLLSGRLRKLSYLTSILSKFNLLHIHKGFSLFHNAIDLKLASLVGKKIIIHYRGSEIRDDMQATFLKPNVIKKITNEASFANKVLVKDGQLSELIKPYIPNICVFPNIVDIKSISPLKGNIDQHKKLKVVHIPSNPLVKGSEIIRAQMLKIKDIVDYEELSALTHEQVLKKYSESDIIIDQILTGTYGNASLEGMALGVTVLNYLNPTFTQYEPATPPIININESTLCDMIIHINNNRQILIDANKQGKEFIEKFHSYEVVGKKLIELYSSI